MLVENQLIEIRWHNRTKTWYEQKGYKFSHIGETFIVKAEDIYPNSAVNINVKCDHCGKIFSQQYYYYTKTQKKNGTECVHCKGKYNAIKSLSKRQKDFYNDAIDICNKHGYTLVSNPSEYKNSYSIIEYICPKHGLQRIRWNNFKRGVGCAQCGNEKIAKKNRLTQEELTDIVEHKSSTILLNPDDYIGNNISNLKFRCGKCNNIYTTSLCSFIENSGYCRKCGIIEQSKSKRTSIGDVIKIIESKNNNKMVNPNEYKNTNQPISIRCGSCRKIFKQSLSNYRKSNLTGKCPDCNEISYGEYLIASCLDRYRISYNRQHPFHDCCDKRPLPFDFYLPNYNLAIEFDGLQHMKPIYGEDAFKTTKLHDAMKNNYCRWNDIDLLRIPYWERDNIEQILIDYLHLTPQSKNKPIKIKYIPNRKSA
ncbi:hypothetical protein H9X90_04935 [Faecalicatena contorta]|uniref:hypothetical protein n=1 Tax=Faecalicatena contorta TaxID=39482 RepID=UPI00195FCE22|nr:hypothetical protein [Faecalicatena contorta]MBM6686591.1 hypothetical protein [Faecalicatena contorta]MBM6710096.1 hypothetical protein [Faecalicatena contorta]